jgi:DNA repair protein SbcC/Rad50
MSTLFKAMRGKFQETKDVIEKSKELQELLSAAELEVERLTNALGILRQELKEKYENQIMLLKEQSKDWENKFLNMKKQLASSESNTKNKINALQNKINALTDSSTDLAAKVSVLERDLATKQTEYDKLQHEFSETKSSLDAKTNENTNLKNTCKSLEDKISKMQTDLLLKKSENEDAIAKAVEEADLKNKIIIEDLNAKVNLLTVQLKSSKKNEEKQEQTIQELTAKIEEMEKTHEQEMNDMLEEAQSSMKEQNQVEEANEKRISLIKEEYDEELNVLKKELIEKQEEISQLQDENTNLKAENNALNVEITSLKSENQKNNTRDTVNTDTDSGGGVDSVEIATLTDELEVANETIENLKTAVQKLEKKMMDAENKLNDRKVKSVNNEPTMPSKSFADFSMQTEETAEDDDLDDIFGDDEDIFSDNDSDKDDTVVNDPTGDSKSQTKTQKAKTDYDLTASGDFSEKSKQLARIMAFIRDNNIRLLDLFTSLDENNDSVVSLDEFVNGICRVIEGAHDNELFFSKEILQEIFHAADVENQGNLTYKQFLRNFKIEFKRREVRYFAKKMNMLAKRKTEAGRKDSVSLMDRNDMTQARPQSRADQSVLKKLQEKVDKLEQTNKDQATANTELSEKYTEALQNLSALEEKNKVADGKLSETEKVVVEIKEKLAKEQQNVQDLIVQMEEEKDASEQAALGAANLSLDAQLVKLVHGVLRRVEDLNALGFRILNTGGKHSVTRENTAGEFRRRLEDLSTSCKFVFNCLRTRYPGIRIFKEKKSNRIFGSSNLPQLVINGESKGADDEFGQGNSSDYFNNENSIYQDDAASFYNGKKYGVQRKQPAWIRGHLDSLNSPGMESSMYENSLARSISSNSNQYLESESRTHSSLLRSSQQFVMRTMPSSLKSKSSKYRQKRTKRNRPSTVANGAFNFPKEMEKRAWSSHANLGRSIAASGLRVKSTPDLFVGFHPSSESSSELFS